MSFNANKRKKKRKKKLCRSPWELFPSSRVIPRIRRPCKSRVSPSTSATPFLSSDKIVCLTRKKRKGSGGHCAVSFLPRWPSSEVSFLTCGFCHCWLFSALLPWGVIEPGWWVWLEMAPPRSILELSPYFLLGLSNEWIIETEVR